MSRRLHTVRGYRVHGVDLLDFNIQKAIRKAEGNPRTDIRQASYNHTGLETGSFDGAYTMETLVHNSNPGQAISELLRILAPGGRLVLTEYEREHPENLSPEANQALELVNTHAAMPAFQEQFTYGGIGNLLEEHGATNIVREDLTETMLPMLSAFNTLARAPYAIAKALGRAHRMVNAASAVELYKHQQAWRYVRYTAQAAG